MSILIHVLVLSFLFWVGTLIPAGKNKEEKPITVEFYRVQPEKQKDGLAYAPSPNQEKVEEHTFEERPIPENAKLRMFEETAKGPKPEVPEKEESRNSMEQKEKSQAGDEEQKKNTVPEPESKENPEEKLSLGEHKNAGESASEGLEEKSKGRSGRLRFSGEAIDELLSAHPAARARGGRRGGDSQIGPITFDSSEIDFTPYAERLYQIVKRNWYNAIEGSTAAGVFGNRGKVKLQFRILRSGKVVDLNLLLSSGQYALDQAALASVKRSDPLPPLPEDYSQEDVGVTLTYYYNMEMEE